MVILLSGLSSYYVAVATVILALVTMVADVTMAAIAVYGLSFFSSSAVADVVEAMDSANNFIKRGDEINVASFYFL